MTNILKYVIVSVQKQRGTKKPLIRSFKMEKSINRNRSYFVGVGAYSKASESVLLDNTKFLTIQTDVHKRELYFDNLAEFCGSYKGGYIGIFSGDKGIYIEKALVFHENNVTLETLKGCYTKEECFYQAEIISEGLVGRVDKKELFSYLVDAISKLNKYDGFTLKIKDGYVYKLNIIEGELLR